MVGLYPYGSGAGDVESARLDDSCATSHNIQLPMFDQQLSPAYVSDFMVQLLIKVYYSLSTEFLVFCIAQDILCSKEGVFLKWKTHTHIL